MGAALTTALTAYSKLRTRDPHNQTLAVSLLLVLAHVSKNVRGLKAYTIWNCTAVVFNFAFRMRWESPLACNCLSIWAAYRTASADAHKHLVARSGYHPIVYFLGDQVVHLLPAMWVTANLVKNKRWVKPQHGALAFLAQLFFAYSQAGKLDMGEIYVPHDVPFAWAASALGQLLAPSIINNLVRKRYPVALVYLAIVFAPYTIKKLGLRRLINRDTLLLKAEQLALDGDGNGDDDGKIKEMRNSLRQAASCSQLRPQKLCPQCSAACCLRCRDLFGPSGGILRSMSMLSIV